MDFDKILNLVGIWITVWIPSILLNVLYLYSQAILEVFGLGGGMGSLSALVYLCS